MDVEGIFLNEISQRKKYHRSNVESKKNETNENRNRPIDTEIKLMVAKGEESKRWEFKKTVSYDSQCCSKSKLFFFFFLPFAKESARVRIILQLHISGRSSSRRRLIL